jgi:amino acid transporter
MVSELSSTLPEEGGYYAWVRRAMGPFWGFQEAWLSLAASIFDMAIYPTIFVTYLARWYPDLDDGNTKWAIGAVLVAFCALSNISGARGVGGGSVFFGIVLLGPFAVLTALAVARPAVPLAQGLGPPHFDLIGGILIAMWNYMGWDNASTVAGEVDRPQRTYPMAMLMTVLLVALTYIVPVLAATRTGVDPSEWKTGSWADVGTLVAGPALGFAIVAGGMICGFGMCNALVMSYSRLPVALAEDGYLPAAFRWRVPRTGAPWVAIVVCAIAWSLALRLDFEHLVGLDVILYGLSLVLEFIALLVLRIREPQLERPFRVPGGMLVAALLGVFPTVLLAMALWHNRTEQAGPISSLLLGALLAALGPFLYLAGRWRGRRVSSQTL